MARKRERFPFLAPRHLVPALPFALSFLAAQRHLPLRREAAQQPMNPGIIDKLIDRLDKFDAEEIQRIVMRAVEEKGFLEKVFDALREGIIVTGARGTIHYINQAACDFFGFERSEVIRQRVPEQFPGLGWDELVEKGQVVNRDLEVFYPEHRYLTFYISPLSDREEDAQEGEEAGTDPETSAAASRPGLGGYVLILRDTTENRQLHEKELESERINALTMLAAGVAHEIGNPLNSLNIHLQLMERKIAKKADPQLAADLSKALGVARGEIKRLDFIVDKFLSAVRPTSPRLESVRINGILEEAAAFLEPELQDRRISTLLKLAPDVPELRLDGDQMKQVFYNLIRNAAQAIGSGGELTIETSADDHTVAVSFSDDGAGIPADKVSKVFDPYFTTKESGTGLGMLIVQRIVREHGGEIEVKSEEGEGTTVTLYFPRVEKKLRFLPQKSGERIIEVDAVPANERG